jgi:hypothetical protein
VRAFEPVNRSVTVAENVGLDATVPAVPAYGVVLIGYSSFNNVKLRTPGFYRVDVYALNIS